MADQTVAAEGGASTAVVGPFTLRDIVVAVSVALLFLASVLPTAVVEGVGLNQWNSASLFHLGLSILLPAAVLVLFVIRRVAPKTKLRIGSLSVDQFASVTASFATAFYFLIMVNAFSIGAVVGFLGSLGLLTATVFAPWIPQLATDFAGRYEIPAHPVARDAVPARPKAVHPAAARTGAGEEVSEPGSYAPAAQHGAPAAAGAAAQQPVLPEAKDDRTGAAPAPAAGKAAASAVPASTGAGSASAAGSRAPAAGKKAGAAAGKKAGAAAKSGVRTAPAVDSVAPGAADGEAMGIPDTEYAIAAAAVAAELKAGSKPDGPERSGTAAGAGQQGAGQSGAGKQPGQPQVPVRSGAQAQARPAVQAPVQSAARPTGAQPAAAAGRQVAGEAERPPAAKERGAQPGREPAAAAANPGAGPAAARAAGANGAATVALDTVSAGRAAGEEPISATRDNLPQDEETVYEAFWFAVGRTRPVYDENTGAAIFTLEPGAWILALQDRGDEFLVQHTDGRVGVLRDLTNIERA